MSSMNSFYSEVVADANFVTMLDGNAYRWFDFGDLASGATKDYLFYIPNGNLEVWFYGRSFAAGGSTVELSTYIDPVFTNEGTSMADRIFNRNGKSSKTPSAAVWQNPTITDAGILTDHDDTFGSSATGGGNKGSAGSSASQDFPRILPGDRYILARLENTGEQPAHFNYKLYWSELGG